MNRFFKYKNIIWIVLGLALVLRLISLNQSLWLDEATTALVSKMSLGDIFTKFLPGDFHPPLYYILMKGWVSLFGSSEIVLRIPSVIFGIGLIYFVYLVTQKLFDQKTAFISSLLTATSGLLIYYSQEARMYMFVAFLVAVAFYLFLEEKWVLFSIILTLIGLTDYVALFIIPVFLVFSCTNLKKTIKSLIPLFFAFLLWSPIFAKQLSGGFGIEKSAWWGILGTLSWKNLALIPVKFILGRINFDNRILYGIVSLFSVFIYLYVILRQSLKLRPHKIVVGWLTLPIIIGILFSIKVPVLIYFRFIFCLPALYILAAKGISEFSGKKMWVVIGIFLFMNIFYSGKYLLDSRFHREDWRKIALVIGNDNIVYPSDSQKEALTYYQKDKQIVYFGDFNGEKPEIWLSRYVWMIFDPSDSARVRIENLGYNKVQEVNLNGVEIWKYKK